MQPIVRDRDRVLRFRENAIVTALFKRSGLDLDQLVALAPTASAEDRTQVIQLLGYPVDDPRFDEIRRELPEPVTLKERGYRPQPMQPVGQDKRGVLRFRENPIVRELLDRDTERGRVYPDFPARTNGGLNWIAMQDFPREDEEQFAQLIGYSISGYHELSYVSDESAAKASALAQEILPGAGGCRDAGCPFHGGPIDEDDDDDDDDGDDNEDLA
jgi:hypothetical protein